MTISAELDGDAAWEQLVRDNRARPALSRMLDDAELILVAEPIKLRDTTGEKFKHWS